jgi:hypothetical protein
MGVTALLTAPLGLATAPSSLPGVGAASAVTALGLVGTGLAFWIFYTLIATVGPARASLVAYVAPGFAVVYGVTLLGERFTVGTAAGLVLIVAGSWLAAEGGLPRRRQVPARDASPAPSAARATAARGPQAARLGRVLESGDRLAARAGEAGVGGGRGGSA